MNQSSGSSLPLLLAFCLSLLALGIPYWIQPYGQLTLPNSLLGFGSPVVMLAALVLRGFYAQPLGSAILVPAAAAPAVVLLRIVVEVFLVADSHNLWPLELIIACITGALIAGIGGLAGALIARFTGRIRQ